MSYVICHMSNVICQMSYVKNQMQNVNNVNFCRSVPPEFLQSFFVTDMHQNMLVSHFPTLSISGLTCALILAQCRTKADSENKVQELKITRELCNTLYIDTRHCNSYANKRASCFIFELIGVGRWKTGELRKIVTLQYKKDLFAPKQQFWSPGEPFW